MRTIEAQLHDLLLDLVPDQYSLTSQAKIIAEATSVFESKQSVKTASRTESGLIKALWTALASLQLEEDYEYNSIDFVDGIGLDPGQIVRSACHSIKTNNKIKMSKLAMEIINNDDLEVFFDNKDNYIDNSNYNIDDSADEERHPDDVFRSPGEPKSRTDSRTIG
jgi:hypothetical protein